MDRSQQFSEPGLVSLLGGIASDAKELLLQELALTKLEVQNELDKAKSAAIVLSIGIGTIVTGGILLTLMAVHVLAALTVVPLWGCYGIVAGVVVILGTLLLATVKPKVEKLAVVPQQTVARIKESAQWLTNQTTSNKR
jgi:hypothetical protein